MGAVSLNRPTMIIKSMGIPGTPLGFRVPGE
jgi:hypothetical protein